MTQLDLFEASKLISDKYSLRILVGIQRKPKSVQQLSEMFGIPIAACYRKVRYLERAGLIYRTERVLTQKGKRMSLYMSQLKNAYVFFENGKFRVRFMLSNGTTHDFGGEITLEDLLKQDHERDMPETLPFA